MTPQPQPSVAVWRLIHSNAAWRRYVQDAAREALGVPSLTQATEERGRKLVERFEKALKLDQAQKGRRG